MPLISEPLAKALEAIFESKPKSVSEAALRWATAYFSYAASAMSKGGSLPVTAPANLGILLGAFNGAFADESASGAGRLIADGVKSFWSAMVWVGPGLVGSTTSPGNSSLSSALGDAFGDTSEKTNGEKSRAFADAFDAGAKLVIVNDIITATGVPIVGPIS